MESVRRCLRCRQMGTGRKFTTCSLPPNSRTMIKSHRIIAFGAVKSPFNSKPVFVLELNSCAQSLQGYAPKKRYGTQNNQRQQEQQRGISQPRGSNSIEGPSKHLVLRIPGPPIPGLSTGVGSSSRSRSEAVGTEIFCRAPRATPVERSE